MTTTTTTTLLGHEAAGDPEYDQEALAAGIFRPARPQGCGACAGRGTIRARDGRPRPCGACGGRGSY